MKPPQEEYDKIPPLPEPGEQFIHIPGCYCQDCGRTFALYSYSMVYTGKDENGKAYLTKCGVGECYEP
jgi:hypothetical protein